jgi:hypothetical protein
MPHELPPLPPLPAWQALLTLSPVLIPALAAAAAGNDPGAAWFLARRAADLADPPAAACATE